MLGLDQKYHGGFVFEDLDKYEVTVHHMQQKAKKWAESQKPKTKRNRTSHITTELRKLTHMNSRGRDSSDSQSKQVTFPDDTNSSSSHIELSHISQSPMHMPRRNGSDESRGAEDDV